jgi:hypothetical protein
MCDLFNSNFIGPNHSIVNARIKKMFNLFWESTRNCFIYGQDLDNGNAVARSSCILAEHETNENTYCWKQKWNTYITVQN